MIRADRTRFKQALLNLLSNAIKYNREGGEVCVDLQHLDRERVRFNVRDTGPGVPPEHLSELFQVFNRIGAQHTGIEGTGIGLVLTKKLVEAMQGEIGVESAVGKGSTFWFTLPTM